MANIDGVAVVTGSLGVTGSGTKSIGGAALVSTAGGIVVQYAPRRLPYVDGVWRSVLIAEKPGGVSTPLILMIPAGIKDFTLYVVGNAANAAKITKSIDSASEIFTGTPTWRQVHASLDSVGTTLVRYVLGNALPMALRVESLVNDKTAKMVVLGKRL